MTMVCPTSGTGYSRRRRRRQRCFTATELMVVMMVISVLATLAISGVRVVTGHAQRTACASNLSRISQVLRLYAAEHMGRFPETGAASTIGGACPQWGEFADTWDSPGTGCWPDDRRTGNAGNMYLLIRQGLAAPSDFICPASGDRPALGLPSPYRFSFFSFRPNSSTMTAEQQQFLQLNATRHCSYSYQNMLGHHGISPQIADPDAGILHRDNSPYDLAIMADHNPYTQMRGEGRAVLCPSKHPQANSLNHGGEGQNVLYLGGNVLWHDTPLCGARLDDGTHDNIYLPAAGGVDDPENVPRHIRDSYLVP